MKMDRTRAATVGLLVPAALALGMSADTSLRFLEDTLRITSEHERWALCGVVESAIIALTVYAWATRTKGPAYLAYLAVLVQAVPAFTVGGGAGGVFRVVAGPILLAVLLHLLLGLEIRMSGVRPDGIVAAAMREARERLTAFLGIGRRGADSAAIARSRAADRAVALADRVAGVKQGSRKHARLSARLAAAIDAARHGLDGAEAEAAEAAIVSRVVRRKSVAALATIPVRHDWTATLTPRSADVPDEVPARSADVPDEVPARSADVPDEVPAQVRTAKAQLAVVPDEVPPERQKSAPPSPSAGRSADVPALVKACSGGVPAEHETPARGATTRAVRQLIQAGTTDPREIRNNLERQGLKVPTDRYIRRLVSEARNNQTGAYL